MHSRPAPEANPLHFCSAILFSLLLGLMISCDHSKKKQLLVSDTPGIGIQNTVTLCLFYQREYWIQHISLFLSWNVYHIFPHTPHFPLSCFPSWFWMDYKMKTKPEEPNHECRNSWEQKERKRIHLKILLLVCTEFSQWSSLSKLTWHSWTCN